MDDRHGPQQPSDQTPRSPDPWQLLVQPDGQAHGCQEPEDSEDWVAKVICDSPVRRAASMALTTDW